MPDCVASAAQIKQHTNSNGPVIAHALTDRNALFPAHTLTNHNALFPAQTLTNHNALLPAHRIYLPLLSLGKRGRHSFHMPAAEFTATQIATRHCARLVWTLHLTLQEGFDQQMMALLRTRCVTLAVAVACCPLLLYLAVLVNQVVHVNQVRDIGCSCCLFM